MATYCTATDLLLGDLATSSAQDPSKFVQDGTDEIEQMLGTRYVVPFDTQALSYVSLKTIKRINVYLASGGFLVSAFAGDNHLHQTGLSYLKMARDALRELCQGSIILEGAALNPGNNKGTGALVQNDDAESYVDNFYKSTALGPRDPYILESQYWWRRLWGW